MTLDLAFGVILFLGALHGFRRGFAGQMVQLTGLILGILFSDTIASNLLKLFPEPFAALPETIRLPALFFVAMFLVWLAISVTGSIYLAWYRRKVHGDNSPSLGDRVFGTGLGLLKAAFAVSLAVFLLNMLPNETREKFTAVKQQYDESKGVNIANQLQIIEQLTRQPEIQRLRDHLSKLVPAAISNTEQTKVAGDPS